MMGTAALGAAVLVFLTWALPPAATILAPPAWRPARPVVRGAFHVHTVRSDGTGTPDQVAAAAARAGLQFVILTDHGNAMRRPDPPTYRSGVLCLDAVEISTNGGHYAALGLSAAPYPLGGDSRDAVEDVTRLGGMGVVTHPDSRKGALVWTDWQTPIDAVEWLNADSEWRNASYASLAVSLVTYPFRGPETLAALFRRPTILPRLDEINARRRVVIMAGADAHARVAWKGQADPYTERTLLKIPSYEAGFRTFSLHVTLDTRFDNDAAHDAPRLLDAIRQGHLHTIVDGFARNGAFEFTGRSGSRTALEGDDLPLEDAAILRARTNLPPGGTLVLFRDGAEVNRVKAAEMVYATNRPGAYRIEARLRGDSAPMPWIVSNPIHVGRSASTADATGAQAAPAALPSPSAAAAPRIERVATPAGESSIGVEQDWHVEHDPTSGGTVRKEGGTVSLAYQLGAGEARSQFSALSHHGSLPASTSEIAFRAAANGPMRLSVQLRVQRGENGQRWERSIYLDPTPRDFAVPLAEMRPAGPTSTATPPAGAVTSVLFVVDRTHAVAGAAGTFSVERVRVREGPADR